MKIERIKMPRSASGRTVADRFMCDRGHLHPSHALAVRCNRKPRPTVKAKP